MPRSGFFFQMHAVAKPNTAPYRMDTLRGVIGPLELEFCVNFANLIVGEAQVYPQVPPEIERLRTYNLQLGWQSSDAILPRVVGTFAVHIDLMNPLADYWAWVQDEDMQAWFHQGVWDTLEVITLNHQGEFEQGMQALADEIVTQLEGYM